MAVVRKIQQQVPGILPETIYADFFANFDLHPNKNDLSLHRNEAAVKRSIRNLLLTNRGERLYDADIGSDLRAVLFEPISPQTEQTLRNYITETIENYEPRAELFGVEVTMLPDENAYVATIAFRLINSTDPIQFDVLLQRIR